MIFINRKAYSWNTQLLNGRESRSYLGWCRSRVLQAEVGLFLSCLPNLSSDYTSSMFTLWKSVIGMNTHHAFIPFCTYTLIKMFILKTERIKRWRMAVNLDNSFFSFFKPLYWSTIDIQRAAYLMYRIWWDWREKYKVEPATVKVINICIIPKSFFLPSLLLINFSLKISWRLCFSSSEFDSGTCSCDAPTNFRWLVKFWKLCSTSWKLITYWIVTCKYFWAHEESEDKHNIDQYNKVTVSIKIVFLCI